MSSLRVVEHFLCGKKLGGPEGGEDHILLSDNFVGLFDGVTSRGRAVEEGLLLDGSTPGRWAALRLAEAVKALPSNATFLEASVELSKSLREGQEELGVSPAEWGWPAAAQTTVYSVERREIWRLGDTHIGVNGVALPGNPTPIDGPAVAFRAAYLWALIAGGAREGALVEADPSWERLLPLLEVQHNLRNHEDRANPFAYGLFDGRDVPERFLQIFKVRKGDEVVFATDGYLGPRETLAKAEEELAACLRQDPLLVRLHLGFRPVSGDANSFDDRAYVRFVAP